MGGEWCTGSHRSSRATGCGAGSEGHATSCGGLGGPQRRASLSRGPLSSPSLGARLLVRSLLQDGR